MNTHADYFELFQLPRQFEIDLAELAERYRAVQAEVHPDRHASGSDQQRLLAMQYSTHANDAYQCLKTPVRRAGYLLELAGHPCDFENYTLSDGDFLMRQMLLREELAESDDVAAVDRFAENLTGMLKEEQADFVRAYQGSDYTGARDSVSRLHFLFKLQAQADLKVEELDDAV